MLIEIPENNAFYLIQFQLVLAIFHVKPEQEENMETYLTVDEVASHLKLAVQTIRRYVLNKEIPYCKIKKVVRFRLSEIERWVNAGGNNPVAGGPEEQGGDLFNTVWEKRNNLC